MILSEEANNNDTLQQNNSKGKEIFDGDDLLAQREEEALSHITCPKTRQNILNRRRYAEEIVVCEMLLKQWQSIYGMEGGDSLNEEQLEERRRIVLCYAAALEGLGRRRDAVDALRLCLGVCQEVFIEHEDSYPSGEQLDVSVALALTNYTSRIIEKNKHLHGAMPYCKSYEKIKIVVPRKIYLMHII